MKQIIITRPDQRLTWNWQDAYDTMPLCRVVVMPCREIDDGDHGFFLTCPSEVGKLEVAAEVTVLMSVGNSGMPMILCLEDEPDGRRLVLYFLTTEAMQKYLVERTLLRLRFRSDGGAPEFRSPL